MKHRLFLIVAMTMSIPAMLAAQDGSVSRADQPDGVFFTDAGLFLPVLQAPVTAAAQQTAPARVERRRRPSMVGYIEDATLISQVRLRFDAGFGNNVPDRAEFFYAKCGCYKLDPEPFFDPDAPGPGPGVPTELRHQQFYLQADYVWRDRLSLFAELPFRAIQPQGFLDFGEKYTPFPNQSGLGDIRAGAKGAIISDDERALTVMVRASLPTGDAGKGLGTDNFSLEPGLVFHQNLTDRLGLEAQLVSWHPFGGSDGVESPDKFSGNIISYGIGPSFDLLNTDRIRFTPVVELVGWRVIGGFGTDCAAECTFPAADNIVNLKFGARTTIAGRNSFYVGYGRGLTDAVWYDDILRLEYRFAF